MPAYVGRCAVARLDTSLASLCEATPYASTATVAFGYRARAGRPSDAAAPASSSRASSTARCWPAPGSPRSGPGRAPDGTCCCARSSAAAAIRTASSAATSELIEVARGGAVGAAADLGRAAVRAALRAGRARARSTRSVTCSAWPGSTTDWPACPGCSSPAAASARSAFPTASPTDGRRRPWPPRSCNEDGSSAMPVVGASFKGPRPT